MDDSSLAWLNITGTFRYAASQAKLYKESLERFDVDNINKIAEKVNISCNDIFERSPQRLSLLFWSFETLFDLIALADEALTSQLKVSLTSLLDEIRPTIVRIISLLNGLYYDNLTLRYDFVSTLQLFCLCARLTVPDYKIHLQRIINNTINEFNQVTINISESQLKITEQYLDIRDVYCYLCVIKHHLKDYFSRITSIERILLYVHSCYNKDFKAFSFEPDSQPHLGFTFVATSIVRLILDACTESLLPESDAIVELITTKFVPIFSDMLKHHFFYYNTEHCSYVGRFFRKPDSCYNFWATSAYINAYYVINGLQAVRLNAEQLGYQNLSSNDLFLFETIPFLKRCYDEKTCGFRKSPFVQQNGTLFLASVPDADIMHTHYSLLATLYNKQYKTVIPPKFLNYNKALDYLDKASTIKIDDSKLYSLPANCDFINTLNTDNKLDITFDDIGRIDTSISFKELLNNKIINEIRHNTEHSYKYLFDCLVRALYKFNNGFVFTKVYIVYYAFYEKITNYDLLIMLNSVIIDYLHLSEYDFGKNYIESRSNGEKINTLLGMVI